MAFYDMPKTGREQKRAAILAVVHGALLNCDYAAVLPCFDDGDTYIRQAAYLAVGRTYKDLAGLRGNILDMLGIHLRDADERVRQTAVYSCGEIAALEFGAVEPLLEYALKDPHHSVRNAVQGALKKAGSKNPEAIIAFCQKHILDEDPEVRRQVTHGLELRGRTHPEDILPVLRLLQFETHRRVRPMLIHVFGQISYKSGCLEKVTAELLTWDDKALAGACFDAIIEQHRHAHSHLRTIKTLPPEECEKYIASKKLKKQWNLF